MPPADHPGHLSALRPRRPKPERREESSPAAALPDLPPLAGSRVHPIRSGVCAALSPCPGGPWASYQGALRSLLLRQRREPSSQAIPCLASCLAATLPASAAGAERRGDPQLETAGQPPAPADLPRAGPAQPGPPGAQQGHAGTAPPQPPPAGAQPGGGLPGHPSGVSRSRRSRQGLLLVDDILTTGATAMAAAAALEEAGYPVMGLLCLARTPAPGRDLRSCGAAKRPAGIAQLVEQATENRRVPSSNLGPGILF